jgi:cell division protease FtsH
MNNKQNRGTDQNPRDMRNRQDRKSVVPNYGRNSLRWIVVIIMVFMAMMMLQQWRTTDNITWSEFESYIESKQVESIEIDNMEIRGKFNKEGAAGRKGAPAAFSVDYKSTPSPFDKEDIKKWSKEYDVKVKYVKENLWLIFFMQWILPLLLFGGLIYLIFVRNLRNGAGSMLMSFGRSKHRVQSKGRVKVTFNDVAGVDEAKEELAEIIEFLKNPKKFQRLGGRIPRGVLLMGPPGCGKTLLAKAISGQADVPFFSISGSDFVEMFVGVGASRVRDLFRQAKENSPCIIFLDEVDAIGRKRGAGYVGGGHDEREQTLNAILVEMDGFDTNDKVIVIAATNRADILDHALTRPGRFDRQVFVPLPDVKGRMDILKIHAKKVKLGPDVNLERMARGTPMFTGADLAAIINEAALMATMANKDSVEMADLEEARDKVRWGRAKKSRVMDDKERYITAFHEAGHTLVQSLLKDADPLHKVSIIPRGPMGGATFALPEKDRTIFTKRYCLALMQVCFGGRVAEELFCDDISSGAQSDIETATKIAKRMVLMWGMSDELGPINYDSDLGVIDAAYTLPSEKDYSEVTAEVIDKEIKRIMRGAYEKAKELIQANKNNVEKIATALLKYETLDADDVKLILGGGEMTKPTVRDLLAAEQARAANSSSLQDESEQGRQSQPSD